LAPTNSLPHQLADYRFQAQATAPAKEKEVRMSTTIARMTKKEFREMIETTIEQKLLELIGDPDEGMAMRKTVLDRLTRQRKAVADGERGQSFEEVVRRLR